MLVYDRIRSLELHRRARGKVKIFPTISVNNEEDAFLASYPGSVAPGMAIVENKDMVYEYTGKGNRLAVVSDGSAICGMGNVGPLAGMPMIEGKCLLFKLFGDVNAIPLCVSSENPDEFIHMVSMIAPNFGGINLEDISSPNTFTILRKLERMLDMPVFCDDQDGTAMLVVGALINAMKVVGKKLEDIRIVFCGAGAGGIAAAQLLLHAGARNLVLLNSKGILGPQNPSMNYVQEELAARTNPEGLTGGLEQVVRGADVLVG
ncbi:MAG TPA: malic enzyme-like NAD(P)-binding protein, partial [Synergistaceae bacterium]|nr:malic enzyme-like NAD(P)-binding protein [Synergistaceae bacterium]